MDHLRDARRLWEGRKRQWNKADKPSRLLGRDEAELVSSDAGVVDCGLLYCVKARLFFGITHRMKFSTETRNGRESDEWIALDGHQQIQG